MIGLLKQYLWVLNLVTILLCAYFSARLTNLYLENKIAVKETMTKSAKSLPPVEEASPQSRPAFAEYKIILDRNVFDSTELPPTEAPFIFEETVPTGTPVKTSLNIKVVGVLVVGAGIDERSTATVAGGTGTGASVDTYAVGTENGFAPNTKLTRVQPDRIEFLHQGRLEYALMEEELGASIFGPPPTEEIKTTAALPTPTEPTSGEGIQKEGEGRFVIDQGEVQNALNNIDRLYTEIRAVPNFAGGRVSGLKILSVKQGSLFDKLGLQRGDILKRINGLELDVKRGFDIFNQLKNESRLTVDLVRQGQNETYEYEIR